MICKWFDLESLFEGEICLGLLDKGKEAQDHANSSDSLPNHEP